MILIPIWQPSLWALSLVSNPGSLRPRTFRNLNEPESAERQSPALPAMPSSEYGNAVGGGLKLKGAKDAGVKKHKKKKPKADSGEPKPTDEAEKEQRVEQTKLQKALAEEEKKKGDEVADQQEAEVKEYGKTEAQRRHDERRKKRVCSSHPYAKSIGASY